MGDNLFMYVFLFRSSSICWTTALFWMKKVCTKPPSELSLKCPTDGEVGLHSVVTVDFPHSLTYMSHFVQLYQWQIFAPLYSRCLMTKPFQCYTFCSFLLPWRQLLGGFYLSLVKFMHNNRGHFGCTQMCLHGGQWHYSASFFFLFFTLPTLHFLSTRAADRRSLCLNFINDFVCKQCSTVQMELHQIR